MASEFVLSKYKTGFLKVLVSNAVYMILSVLIGFILPQKLSYETYAQVKTYYLYISYVGLLHIGYLDGIFIKYGGKDIENIDKVILNSELTTFTVFQTFISGIFVVLGIAFSDYIILAFAFSIIPLNVLQFYKMFYQAIGEFEKYSRIIYTSSIINFIGNIVLACLLESDNFSYYLILYLFLSYIVLLYFSFSCRRVIGRHNAIKFSHVYHIVILIKDGFFVMLGNIFNSLLTGMDRWFIKIVMESYSFAQYSFACSLENIISIVTTPLAITLYSFLCRVKDIKTIKVIRSSTMVFGGGVICSAYICEYYLSCFMNKYIDAIDVIFFLFCAQFYFIIIKSIYVNLYKAMRKQRVYFLHLVIVLFIGIFLNAILYKFFKSKEAFAIATLISSIIWFLVSAFDFREYKFDRNEIIYIFLVPSVFLFLGKSLKAFNAFCAYIFFWIIISYILMKEPLSELSKCLKKEWFSENY